MSKFLSFKNILNRINNLFYLPLLLILLATLSSSSADYMWPTNASKLLTSSFCEFRPRHYHAAIDIKTWSRSGYRIFAIDDGYVMRVRVSAFGYGRAIYLKLKDGNIIVYAHLSKFWPALEKYVNDIRLSSQKYRVDLHLKPGQFNVEKGQMIGYTGKTGIGKPHLHFEIRDPENKPVNPLLFYHGVLQDTIRPQLYQVAFIPLDHKSLVNFKTDTIIYDLGRQNEINLNDTLFFSGKIGIVLKAYDSAQGATNQFSFYKANMFLDDSLVYTVGYNNFSYAETHQVELDKNFSLWRKGKGVFHNFYRHEENQLNHYQGIPADAGVMDSNILSEGLHQLRIEISDYWNNTAHFKMNFLIGNLVFLKYDLNRWLENDLFLRIQSPEPLEQINVLTKTNTWDWNPLQFNTKFAGFENRSIYHYTFTVTPSPPEQNKLLKIIGIRKSGVPTVPLYISPLTNRKKDIVNQENETTKFLVKGYWFEAILQNENPKFGYKLDELKNQINEIFWFPIDEKTYQLHIPIKSYLHNREAFSKFISDQFENFHLIKREKSETIFSEDSIFQASYPPLALYNDIIVHIHTNDHAPQLISTFSGYQQIGKIYILEPFDQPVNKGIWIKLYIPKEFQSKRGIGIYYWDPKKGWIFIPAVNESVENYLSARVTSMEIFTLIQDTIPPLIIPMQRVQNNRLFSNNNYVQFMVKDEMSGIQKESQIQVFLNDNWQLFNYDPEEDYISIKLPNKRKKDNRLKLVVKDNAGNYTEKEYFVP